MRIKPLLLFVLGLCACGLSCVSPGSRQMESPHQANAPEVVPATQTPAPFRRVKRIPSSLPDLKQPPVLSWNQQTRNLTWYYSNPGDYNQDGETNTADVTQIAAFFGKSAPFNETSLAAEADGDRNGEVNTADITPIVLNHLNRFNKYNVYSSVSEDDIPTEPDAENGPGAELADVLVLADAVALVGQRKTFALHQAADTGGVYFWVRCVQNNAEGFASNAVLVSEGPVATLAGLPASGNAPLRVTLDGSLSSGGVEPINSYRWDFDGDGIIDLDSGQDSVVEHLYNDPGTFVAKLTVATASSISRPATFPISVSPAGFSFTPWDETFAGGGAAGEFSISSTDLGDTIEVEIYADNAIGLAALFGVLSYDQEALRFVECLPSLALSSQGEVVSFNQVAPDSRLHIGHSMVLPQEKAGLFGDHLLATAVFAKEPETPVDLVYRVPRESASAITDLSASRLDNILVWRYNSNGDFNQDGTVLASDLSVLAHYWGASGMFNPYGIPSLADANGDTFISEGDIVVMAAKYYQRITGFNIFGSNDSSDYPLGAGEPNGAGTQALGYLPLLSSGGNTAEKRRRYEFSVPGESMPDFLWVRPVYDGAEGVPSNMVEPSTEIFISPNWTDSDWEGVSGDGVSAPTPLRLGQTGDGRTFSFIASTQPGGSGSLIDVATLNWAVVAPTSGTIPEPGVLIPTPPISIGYFWADDGLGVFSNKVYFFAGASPGD